MENKDNTKVILVIVTGFLVLSYLFARDEALIAYSKPMIIASTSIGIVHLLFPTVGELIVKFWYKIGHVLGWINTRIILSLIFYLILFPASIAYKLANKNSLQRKRTKGSVFIERNHTYSKADLENIW